MTQEHGVKDQGLRIFQGDPRQQALLCRLCGAILPLSAEVLKSPCPECGKGPEMPEDQVEKGSQDAR